MITSLDCLPCFARQALEATRAVSVQPAAQEQLLREVLQMAAGADLTQAPPVLGQQLHRRLRQLSGMPDPYRAAKDRFNRLALNLLPELSERVKAAADPFEAAVRLATAANVIDLGAKGGLSESDVSVKLELALNEPFAGEIATLRFASSRASRILYLADNTGEIVVDRLLIEQLPAGRVTVSVRGAPVLNDATRIDAQFAGIDAIAELIDNGSDAPGTVLEDCSPDFRTRFESADVIISKGQGNYETLSGVEANIFFLLKIKCPVVAAQTGIENGLQALIHHTKLSCSR